MILSRSLHTLSKRKKFIFPPVCPVALRHRRHLFLLPFLSLVSSLVHPSLLICFRPCCDELRRNKGISTFLSDLQASVGGVVSRRGWFLGVLAVKSAFWVAEWSRSMFLISRFVALWRWERMVVCGCLLSL